MTEFATLAATSRRVAATPKRTEKVAALAETLATLDAAEIEAATAFLVGETRYGRIGVGWATIAQLDEPAAAGSSLSILDVDRTLAAVAAEHGPGSAERRRARLAALFAAATVAEQTLLRGILGGELRQGALDGVIVSAVAAAATVPVAAVRRAAMFTGDVAVAARIAISDGRAALDRVALRPLHPVAPMLASPAADIGEALADGAPVLVEWKLDGARVQVHRVGPDVRVFTRNRNDVTARLPAVVEMVGALPGGDLVLDGEAIGLLEDGAPQRFQDTISEFSSDGRTRPLRAFFFDLLHVDGRSVHDEPLVARRAELDRVVPRVAQLPSIVTADRAAAQRFFDEAVAAGQEGVVVKDLAAPYEAGRRGAAWRKVKPVHTFDLVVLAVEWGHGRRRGRLSNLHLGARTGEGSAGFVMVGKTFKGLTDELLAWQTERFLELAVGSGTGRDAHVVHVRPEQVVEVAIDGVQVSTRYPGGVALRFARVRRYRSDKSAADADTVDALRALRGPVS